MKLQRWWAILLALLVVGAVAATSAQEQKEKPFVGNKNSKKYHTRECEWGKKISPKNRIEFSTVEEAEKAGYAACKVCHPNRKDKPPAPRESGLRAQGLFDFGHNFARAGGECAVRLQPQVFSESR
jgi:hypothetical protein